MSEDPIRKTELTQAAAGRCEHHTTPMQYLANWRLQRAARLLERPSMSIAQAAAAVRTGCEKYGRADYCEFLPELGELSWLVCTSANGVAALASANAAPQPQKRLLFQCRCLGCMAESIEDRFGEARVSRSDA